MILIVIVDLLILFSLALQQAILKDTNISLQGCKVRLKERNFGDNYKSGKWTSKDVSKVSKALRLSFQNWN